MSSLQDGTYKERCTVKCWWRCIIAFRNLVDAYVSFQNRDMSEPPGGSKRKATSPGAGSNRPPPPRFFGPDGGQTGHRARPPPTSSARSPTAGARVSFPPPQVNQTMPVIADQSLEWLSHFDAIWGHIGDYDHVTGLFLAERRDNYGRTLASFDMGPRGPTYPITRFVAGDPADDIFERFCNDHAHWDRDWQGVPPPERDLVLHHVRVLRRQMDWLLQAREASYQAYESQLRLVRSMHERGEMRLRSLPEHSGYWGLGPMYDVVGLMPYLAVPFKDPGQHVPPVSVLSAPLRTEEQSSGGPTMESADAAMSK